MVFNAGILVTNGFGYDSFLNDSSYKVIYGYSISLSLRDSSVAYLESSLTSFIEI